jgi:hypothetical protein
MQEDQIRPDSPWQEKAKLPIDRAEPVVFEFSGQPTDLIKTPPSQCPNASLTAKHPSQRRQRPHRARRTDFADPVSAGIVDPVEVCPSAAHNGSSIAGIILTTETLFARKPDDFDPTVERA